MTSMKFFHLMPLVAPYRSVLAVPLSYTTTVTTKTYVPLLVVSMSLFFLVVVVVVKLVYMKHRRIGTIHAPSGNLSSSTSCFGFRDKRGGRHRGLLVGCLGSPAWETNLTSKLGAAGRRSSFAYQLHMRSTTLRSSRTASARSRSKNSSSGSRLTKSTIFTGYSGDADPLVMPLSSGSSRIPPSRGGSSFITSTDCRPRYGDFGEFNGVRSPRGGVPKVARRASPSSIRLVDGPSHSNQVDYAFLSALPPNAIVASPLMGARDSFQLSRCSLKCNRTPVPPMPSLPSFLPFYLPKPETLESHVVQAREYLPPLHFSPLASVAKVFHSQHQVVERKAPNSRAADLDESRNVAPSLESASSSKTHHASNAIPLATLGIPTLHTIQKAKLTHKRSQSSKDLAIGGSSQRTTLVADEVKCSEIGSMQSGVLRTHSGSSRDGSVISQKPLKSCLRQNSVVPLPLVCSSDSTLTPSMSEASTQTFARSLGDQASFRTPISDVDIGILGLDRYRWNDEIKELKVRSCHTKKDSVALVPVWE